VLTYHNVIPDDLFDASLHLGVSHSESAFKKHMSILKKRLAPENVLITFDDGYVNQYEVASRILDKHNLKGVFFISFKLLIERQPLTIDKVLQWVSYVPEGQYTIFNSLYTLSEESRHPVFLLFYEKLLNDCVLWETIEEQLNVAYAFNKLRIDPALKRLRFEPLTLKNLSALKLAGHTVAAHSWAHLPLATLPIETQREDFSLSKVFAKKHCNSNLYSYPYGGKREVSSETISLCKEYGFSAAYLNINDSINDLEEDANYQLPRIDLLNNNAYYIEAKLSGFYFFCKLLLGNLLIFKPMLPRMLKWKKRTT
jgi:peptidoglycan/xylan/chitin deacetylase (PgdA/CDA1 family)